MNKRKLFNRVKQKIFLPTVSFALFSVFIPTIVVAQGDDSSSGTLLEEIIVTATKRGSLSLQEIPFSIQVISGEDLASVGAIDFNDFYRRIPGLSVLDAAPGNKRFVVRGVSGSGAGTVGVYYDEVVVTGKNVSEGGFQADLTLFDIDRVEVLKGPQGTTFGSSSLAGTVRYITNKPDPGGVSGRLSAGGRATDGADIGGQFEGMVNIPLVADKLAVRMAAFYQDQPGYIDAPLTGQEGANGVESFAFRGSVQFQPIDSMTLNFMALVQEYDVDGDAFFHEMDLFGNPLGKFEQFNLARVPKEDDIDIYSATFDYEMDIGTLSGSWSRFERNADSAARDATPVLLTLGITPPEQPSIIVSAKNRSRDTFELRFASGWDNPFQILAGVFYSDDDEQVPTLVQNTDARGNPDPNGRIWLDSLQFNTIEELAFFGDISVTLLDRITATVGARYYDFETNTSTNSVIAFPGRPGGGLSPTHTSNEDGVIWKFNLSYELTEDVMAFLNIAEGFRVGGTNNPGVCHVCDIPSQFNSDSLTNYEAGMKTVWMDNRLQINGAVYYLDWSDIQMQQFAIPPPGSGITGRYRFQGNGGAADVLGVEFDITASPTENLRLGAVLNYVEAELAEDVPGGGIGLDGDELEYTPEFTFVGSADYTQPMASWTGSVGMDVIHVSDQTTATSPLDSVYRKLDSYWLVNLRARISSKEDWSVNVVASNILDDDSIRTAYDATALAPLSLIANRPRSVFFTVEKAFGGK